MANKRTRPEAERLPLNAKRKGDQGEREMLRVLEAHGIPATRNQQGPLAGFAGGFRNPDISFSMGRRSFHGEVKRCERLSVYRALDQAIRDADGQAVPVVLHRRNRREWLAILRLDDFLTAAGYGGDDDDGAFRV